MSLAYTSRGGTITGGRLRREILDLWGLGDSGRLENHSKRWGAKLSIFLDGVPAARARPAPKNQRASGRPNIHVFETLVCVVHVQTRSIYLYLWFAESLANVVGVS